MLRTLDEAKPVFGYNATGGYAPAQELGVPFLFISLGGLATMSQGSGGNVLAALCSFFIPGLGQLLQGRLFAAIFYFVLTACLWVVLLGWIVHIVAVLDAARFKGH